MATFAPSAWNSFAVASPMPLLPPVIATVLPSNLFAMGISPLILQRGGVLRCLFVHFDECQSVKIHFSIARSITLRKAYGSEQDSQNCQSAQRSHPAEHL